MPQPFTVQPGGGSHAGTTVVSVDSAGNEVVTGSLTTGPIIMPKVTAAPAGVPLSLVLYTDDGITLKFLGAGGVAGGVGGVANLTSGGTLSGVFSAAGTVFTGAPDFQAATAAGTALTTDVTGDTVARLAVTGDGTMKWGSGSGAADCILDRYAAGGLELNCALRFSAGQLLFGPAGDVDLYWGGAGLLKTDNNLTVGGALTAVGYTVMASGQTNGNFTVFGTALSIGTAGGGLLVKEGANATMGTGTLNGTTAVVVNTTKVTANSRIFLSIQAPGGTPSGTIYVSARTAGTSFSVKSQALDTSTFAWLIVEPA
jgi:hypothetical protein